MKAFLQLYISSLKEFTRDRLAIFWTLAFPVLFIVLFGIIFSGGGSATYNIGVAVQDKGQIGTQIASAFNSVSLFRVTQGTQDELLDKFKKGDFNAVVVVPDGLTPS